MIDTIKSNLRQIQEDIAPYTPNIIAVTKYFGIQEIIYAYEAGIKDFGESKVIEASDKINSLPNEVKEQSKFHFIGHLQSNKVRKAVKVFDYIHSVDSLKLAEIISKEAISQGKVQNVFLQLNNAREEQKSGFSKEELYRDFSSLLKLKGLKVLGLMNIAPLGAEDNELEELFEDIRLTQIDLSDKNNIQLNELSMGMSKDYRIAAKHGSTVLRIGRKLFNEL